MPGDNSGEAILTGIVQRQLKRIVLGDVVLGASSTASVSSRIWLTGLSKAVSVIVQAGFVVNGGNNFIPTYPANPGTLQITPITKGDSNDGDLYGNPIFSSPSFTGPLTLPNGWEFNTLAPKAMIDVVFNAPAWSTLTAGQVVLDIGLEYTGNWWDPKTVAKLLNRVTVEPGQSWVRAGGT
jgi:hypothetical protein